MQQTCSCQQTKEANGHIPHYLLLRPSCSTSVVPCPALIDWDLNTPFDFFRFIPSLSTTPSAHCTFRLSRLLVPRRRRMAAGCCWSGSDETAGAEDGPGIVVVWLPEAVVCGSWDRICLCVIEAMVKMSKCQRWTSMGLVG